MITRNNTRNLRELIVNAGEQYENLVFYRFEQDEMIYDKGYGSFTKDCLAVAGYIQAQEKKEGHCIHAAILGGTSYEYLTVLLGVPCAGGIAIPIDVKLSVEKLAVNLKKADVDILFFDREFTDQVEQVAELCPFIKRIVCLQSRKNVRCVPMIHRVYRDSLVEGRIDDNQCAVIIFTSGTTGNSKGVMLSHSNLLDNMFCTDNEREVSLNVLPINHIFCISSDVLITLKCGGTLCQCNDVSKMNYYMQLFAPQNMRVVPMMLKLLVNRATILKKQNPEMSMAEVKERIFGRRLQKVTSGGGYLAPELAALVEEYGISARQGYGMSECSPKICNVDFERIDKVSSVGRIVTGCIVRFVEGEIQVKSPSVMLGYYNDEELTKEAITEDGYLCTGDLGYMDEEGFLYLTGRKKNLIILSNGENVSPEMIEKCFDGDTLIGDIVAYGDNDRIVAQVYPNYEYAQTIGLTDIKSAVDELVSKHNKELPSYAQIMECIIRDVPFEKTTSRKVVRSSIMTEIQIKEDKKKNARKPESELQQKLYDLVLRVLGDIELSVDDNLFKCGLDSMGCTMLISDIAQELGNNISLAEIMDAASIEGIEKAILEKAAKGDNKHEIREAYPLTSMMMYFAYVIPGNTTGNLPYALRLDKSVDLNRLKEAILKVLDAHPSLKAICKPAENKYLAVFRDDSRVIDIPIEKIKESDVKAVMQQLVVPFDFKNSDYMVHIKLFEGEEYNYMFMDVAHFMGDGMTMKILMDDINLAYSGSEVEKEDYTTYDYILEERERVENGVRQKDIEYIDTLMKGSRLSGSLLNNAAPTEELQKGVYGSIRKRFSEVARKEIVSYGRQHGVSENAYFVTAFNYCIHLFLDEPDVFCSSIHSGRTDSRWDRLAGALFLTYFCRYQVKAHEKVDELLKRTGAQIMETMKCVTSVPREGEMFFQFQGDILQLPKIGDCEPERVGVQLDSLPFHFQVMYDDKGYYTELRYWENRFDREVLEVFLVCFEAVLKAMLSESSVRLLKRHMPKEVYPRHLFVEAKALREAAGFDFIPGVDDDEMVRVYVFDENYNKKPFGAWGPMYVMNYEPVNCTETVQYPYGPGTLYGTGLTARVLKDGTVDFKHQVGKKVLYDGSKGRIYYDLKKNEEILMSMPEIESAECYLAYDTEGNEMTLWADVKANTGLYLPALKERIKDEYGPLFVPKFINVIE